MNSRARIVGTPIVYMATAIMAAAIAEAVLVISNGGRFPFSFWPVVIVLLSPLVGLVVASRYWSETEFAPSRVVLTPLLLVGLMVVVLAATSFLVERPNLALGQLPQTIQPQVSPSLLPALPPPPTRAIRSYAASADRVEAI
jgi:RsiW-degrading membrane proteinase PrsW (M82 family)